MTDKADWLRWLTVGDPVVVNWSGYRTNRSQVQRVKRVTATLFVTDRGVRIRRRDGNAPGEFRYNGPWITQPTAAQARKAAR